MKDKETLFVGLYAAERIGPLPENRIHPVDGSIEVAGSYDLYQLTLLETLQEYAGRLLIDWGPGYRSWIQRGDKKMKGIVELRRSFSEPAFPGFQALSLTLSSIDTLPTSWMAALSATRGIYLLVCPRTREQYVGKASGSGGFLSRWREYGASGHGGNIALKSRDASDYQISILETVGTAVSEAEILALEMLWKDKLKSREMGLNRN